jgi:hypothetical protein
MARNRQGAVLALKLKSSALQHAENLVTERKFVFDERNDWSEHQLRRRRRTSSSRCIDFGIRIRPVKKW